MSLYLTAPLNGGRSTGGQLPYSSQEGERALCRFCTKSESSCPEAPENGVCLKDIKVGDGGYRWCPYFSVMDGD